MIGGQSGSQQHRQLLRVSVIKTEVLQDLSDQMRDNLGSFCKVYIAFDKGNKYLAVSQCTEQLQENTSKG